LRDLFLRTACAGNPGYFPGLIPVFFRGFAVNFAGTGPFIPPVFKKRYDLLFDPNVCTRFDLFYRYLRGTHVKLLMFDTNEFWYKPFSKTIESAPDAGPEKQFPESLVIFINVEAEDEIRTDKVVKKAVDNILWLAKKTSRTRVVLHSFAHLSESKSSPGFAEAALVGISEGLAAKGLTVSITPFGYFLEFRIHVRGESLAKVWKSV
jgi:hypothetical protein